MKINYIIFTIAILSLSKNKRKIMIIAGLINSFFLQCKGLKCKLRNEKAETPLTSGLFENNFK